MGKLKAFINLTRIEHSIMLVIAVLAAELIVLGRLPNNFILAMSLITPILVSMGSFSINDYFDVEADKANKLYKRPLVSGEISKRAALYISIICLVAGPIFSIFINIYAFVIAVIFSALAFLYSYRLKDVLLVGNIYIAFSMAIPLLYGNFVIFNRLYLNPAIALASVVVFLAGLAREIHGMVRDVEGDKKARGSRNLVYHMGEKRSNYMALALYLESIGISIYMFFLYRPFAHNIVYIAPIIVVDLMLLYVSLGHLKYKDRKFYKLSRNLSLFAMAIAILAFLASALVYVKL